MQPKIVCPVCSAEVKFTDKFCSSCGTKLEWGGSPAASSASAVDSGVTLEREHTNDEKAKYARCGLCGNLNSSDAAFCESCGSVLSRKQVSDARPGGKKTIPREGVSSPLNVLQSWKMTVGVAILLAAVIVVAKVTRNTNGVPNQPKPAAMEAITQEIESLQKSVDANPNDLHTLLQLANRLQDARFFSKAISIYAQYLGLDPSNADARVDLGICYFELALSDTGRKSDYLGSARREMEKALEYAPNHQRAHYNLGIVSLHAGDVVRANEWFRKCVVIDSTSEIGKKAQLLVNQHTFNQPS